MGTKKEFIHSGCCCCNFVNCNWGIPLFFWRSYSGINEIGQFRDIYCWSGEVISTTQATGVIESENEVILLSPAASIIKSILKEPGNKVQAGDIILQLQTEPVLDEIERLKDQMEVKRNNLEKTS